MLSSNKPLARMDSHPLQHDGVSPDEHRPLASSQVEISRPSHSRDRNESPSSGMGSGDHSVHAGALSSSRKASQTSLQKHKQKSTKSMAVCMVSTYALH